MKAFLLAIVGSSMCFGDSLSQDPPVQKKSSFFAPLTDLCWNCFLPIHIAGHNVFSSQKDFVPYQPIHSLCHCKGFVVGIPIAFWEPQAIVEVTRSPYKFLFFANPVSPSPGYEKWGSISNSDAGRSSFYNVHYYFYPLTRLAAILPGFTCLRNTQISLPVFMTEWVPFWNDMDSRWHWLLDPVRFIYQHPELQELCKEDCKASMNRKPVDSFPWCAGCLGSLYPFSGHVPHHIGGIQASSLLVCRTVALMHSFGLFFPGKLNVFGLGMGANPEKYCAKTYSYKLKKTIYKTQLAYPVPDKGQEQNGIKVYCHPLGESDRDWGAGHTFPKDGEDFIYIVWTKNHCCYDLLDIIKKTIGNLSSLIETLIGKEKDEHEKTKQKYEDIVKNIEENVKKRLDPFPEDE